MGNSSSSCSSIRNRTNSISGIFSTADDSNEKRILDNYQKIILRAAWKHMSTKASHGSCGKTVLKRLSLKDSTIKTIFQKFSVLENIFYLQEKGHIAKIPLTSTIATTTEYCSSFEQHSKIFLNFLQFLMENLDNSRAISEKCEEIGKFHRKFKVFGLQTEHWDLFGESITETVREYQGWRKHRQAVMATNILVSFVTDRIRSGFLQRTEISLWVKTPHPTLDTDIDYALSRKSSSRRIKNHLDQFDIEINAQQMKANNKKHIIRSKSDGSTRTPRRKLPLTPDDIKNTNIRHHNHDSLQVLDVWHEFQVLDQKYV